ncbi:MAG TPA: 50S ribosomal protein L23 [Phycisphaerae bacterium]|nr:50S ribosomal protein L23 [Phycisphaerae bacterium]
MALQLHDTEVIKAPVISEKSNFLASVKNTYTFEVHKEAGKAQIKSAIEKIYNVRVVEVRTINVPGKPRRTRAGEKTTSEWKKAVVQLHADNKIDLF